MPAIHQLVAGFSNGDAISNEARVLRDTFRRWGCQSELFSESRRILPQLRRECGDAEACRARCAPDDVVLLHLSIGSVVNDIFAALPCRKAILYHNVTPSHYFDMVNKQTAFELARGRRQVQALAGTAAVTMADSRFNADELTACGYDRVRVLPLVLDLDGLTRELDRGVLRKLDDGACNILFVGRCAPNKRIEDLLEAFRLFRAAVEPNARLCHVGSFAGTEPYYYLQLVQAKELGPGAVKFAGAIPQAELNAYYRSADLFLCMSEHEGFCIPLLEAMTHDVPILAYDAGAVAETLDGAGVLFRDKDFPAIAEMMGRLVHDAALSAAIVQTQRERLARYRSRDLAAELREHLAPLLPS